MAVMWGGTWIASRVIAQELPAPLAAAAIRFLLAALLLAAFALATTGGLPKPASGRRMGHRDRLAMTGIFPVRTIYGLRYISAGRGALVVALNPVVVALAAWFLARRK